MTLTGWLAPDRGHPFSWELVSLHLVLWLFALGWLLQRATTGRQRCAAAVAVLVLVPTFFGADVVRGLPVAAGLLLLLTVPRLRVPRVVVTVVGTLASASLAIYLTHYAVYLSAPAQGQPRVLVLLACLAIGTAAWAGGRWATRWTGRWRTRSPRLVLQRYRFR